MALMTPQEYIESLRKLNTRLLSPTFAQEFRGERWAKVCSAVCGILCVKAVEKQKTRLLEKSKSCLLHLVLRPISSIPEKIYRDNGLCLICDANCYC